MAVHVVAFFLAPSAAQAQESEVVTLLRELVQVNTRNPPGSAVAELLAPRLRAANPTEKPILLAGHEDVVGVEPELACCRGRTRGR